MFSVHHIAIICSDYQRSRDFYTRVMGFAVIAEHYREERNSWKLDLRIDDHTQIELFSFNDRPARPSYPEACGLRHLAFAVDDIDVAVQQLMDQSVDVETIRVDEYTGKRFTFFQDPDGLPLELYEQAA